MKRFQRKEARESTKKGKNPKDRLTCHEYDKEVHIKFQCPSYLKKVENNKNNYRYFKSKKAYMDSTSNTLEEEESAKLCLTVNNQDPCNLSEQGESSEEQSSETNYENSPTYDELYGAYVNLHEELKKLVRIIIDRKRVILLHEKKLVEIQKELDELKLENETLDLLRNYGVLGFWLCFIKDYRRVFDLACIDHGGTPEHLSRTCTLEEKEGAICIRPITHL
ncbi:hypothetical protein Lal_00042674 [Lupinus albus]|nr:hypothetical protein Lal_00042674 [Lupinus albus]